MAEHLLQLLGHSFSLNTVVVFPSGEKVLTGSDDRAAGILESATGEHLLQLLGHPPSYQNGGDIPCGGKGSHLQ